MALAICAAVVPLCVVFLDRAIAEYADDHFVRTNPGLLLESVLRGLEGVALLALAGLLADGIRAMTRTPAPPRARTWILCCWAALWAVAAEVILKRVFGRGWPDPTYIGEHQYGFHWLHGGPGWESFPSGTAMVTAAIVAVVWNRESRWRARRIVRTIGTACVVLIAAGLVSVNYHWLSDVIAGSFLGALIGYFTVLLLEEGDASVVTTGARAKAVSPWASS